jgi:uncharacterized membrane protein
MDEEKHNKQLRYTWLLLAIITMALVPLNAVSWVSDDAIRVYMIVVAIGLLFYTLWEIDQRNKKT